MRPETSSATSASSSTIAPRAVFTSVAPSRRSASRSREIRPVVSGVERRVQRDDVRLAQQIVELADSRRRRAASAGGRARACRRPRARRATAAADPPEADDAERRAAQVAPEERRSPTTTCPSVPPARVRRPRRRRRAYGEQQRDREIGGRGVEHARRVRHRDAARAARVDVDLVVADAVVRDEPKRRQAVEHRVVDGCLRRRSAPRRRRAGRPTAPISTSPSSSHASPGKRLVARTFTARSVARAPRRGRACSARRRRSPSRGARSRRRAACCRARARNARRSSRRSERRPRRPGAPPRPGGRAGRAARSSRARLPPRARPRCTRSSCERVRRAVVDDPALRVAEAAHRRMPHRLDDLPRQTRPRPRRWPACSESCTQSSAASASSGRSSVPSLRMSHSVPRSTRNGASRSFTVGDLLRLPSQRVGVEPGNDANVRRVVADRDVLVAAVARCERHLLDRRLAVRPRRVAVQVAADLRRARRARAARDRAAPRAARAGTTPGRGARTAPPRSPRRAARRARRRTPAIRSRARARCRSAPARRRRARPECLRP